ncbi:EF-hand domain-containing protein [Thetidibacter halocola]|uniref:EF-hand domain-containing protein n=1 Tax=Thetidibacter halocola TaxID=2827239 RepID=A0A8J7WDC3_9RHOB|nr:EF-hand domain-containing protein [Thetidibacter halocola]MBS0125510.1 EF-hand domain-containing protein [Thetidibacter halocola]
MIRMTLALILLAAPAFAQQGNPGAHFVENWDLDADGQVTVEEATERRGDVFLTFDANEDGFLDADEYVLFDEARANDMADNGGAQGHGGKGMMNAANGMKLDVNDMDGDGKVSRDEFLTQAATWIAGMDRNGDGVVTTDDFGPMKS